MTPDTLERILNPSYHPRSRRRNGIGLIVVHGIVKSMGGTITVLSEIGSGTEFIIVLPTIDAPSPTADRQGHDQMPSVLVMMTDKRARIDGQVLTRTGFEVITADNGITGVEAYFEHPTTSSSSTSSFRAATACSHQEDSGPLSKGTNYRHDRGGNFWPLGYKPDTLVTDAYLTLASQSAPTRS